MLPRVQPDRSPVGLFDHAGDQLALAVLVSFDHLGALRLANLLHDHLLGRLRCDAPEKDRLHGLLNEPSDFDGRVALPGLRQRQLPVRSLKTLFLGVLDHLPAAEGTVVSSLAVDSDSGVDVATSLLPGSGRQGGFHGVEDDLFRDILLVRNGFNHQ